MSFNKFSYFVIVYVWSDRPVDDAGLRFLDEAVAVFLMFPHPFNLLVSADNIVNDVQTLDLYSPLLCVSRLLEALGQRIVATQYFSALSVLRTVKKNHSIHKGNTKYVPPGVTPFNSALLSWMLPARRLCIQMLNQYLCDSHKGKYTTYSEEKGEIAKYDTLLSLQYTDICELLYIRGLDSDRGLVELPWRSCNIRR